MQKLSQYQVALIAFLAGGLIVIAVFLLTSGGGDDDSNDQATSQTPTATATKTGASTVSPTAGASAEPSATTESEAPTEAPAPSATSAPPPVATATPPAPTATATPPPTFTPTATSTPTPTPTPTPTATVSGGAWEGSWETNCYVSNCATMDLLQTGNTVVGTYGGGTGTINGTVNGNHLVGTWSRSGYSGSIDFWMNAAGTRWQGNYDDYYSWCGRRSGGSYPNPCGVATWYGNWTTNCSPSSCGTIGLQQNGTQVTGTYAGGSGVVNGTANGTTFTGTWTRNGTSGNITFVMQANGDQFRGHFTATLGGDYQWCGYRNAVGYPSPCND